jgi:hypothetical protein
LDKIKKKKKKKSLSRERELDLIFLFLEIKMSKQPDAQGIGRAPNAFSPITDIRGHIVASSNQSK